MWSKLFITAKRMFNGKALQGMSPRGPALFLKVFMSVYIMLCDLFSDWLRLALLDHGQSPFVSLARKPIYQRGEEGGGLPAASPGAGQRGELDVCSARDTSLSTFLIAIQISAK